MDLIMDTETIKIITICILGLANLFLATRKRNRTSNNRLSEEAIKKIEGSVENDLNTFYEEEKKILQSQIKALAKKNQSNSIAWLQEKFPFQNQSTLMKNCILSCKKTEPLEENEIIPQFKRVEQKMDIEGESREKVELRENKFFAKEEQIKKPSSTNKRKMIKRMANLVTQMREKSKKRREMLKRKLRMGQKKKEDQKMEEEKEEQVQKKIREIQGQKQKKISIVKTTTEIIYH